MALLNVTGTQPNVSVLHLDLAGSATDDIGVSAVRLTIRDRDSSRYIQPNGTLAAAYALLDATLANPGATSTTWTLSIDLPSAGRLRGDRVRLRHVGPAGPLDHGGDGPLPRVPR